MPLHSVRLDAKQIERVDLGVTCNFEFAEMLFRIAQTIEVLSMPVARFSRPSNDDAVSRELHRLRSPYPFGRRVFQSWTYATCPSRWISPLSSPQSWLPRSRTRALYLARGRICPLYLRWRAAFLDPFLETRVFLRS